jgi:dihydroxy-acid dehydratase
VLQAIGGSTNALVHLAAIAGRAGLAIDYAEFDRIGRAVPVLVDLKPSGRFYMEHFHQSGGLPRLLAELADLLDLDAPAVGGGTLRDAVMKPEDRHEQEVIRPRHNPLKREGAMAVLGGNLCPQGAVIKHSAASERLLQHSGRAVVFDSIEDMTRRIDDPALEVGAEDVLVLRNAGPKGAPGMPEAGYLPIPRKLAAAGVSDMLRISDARMSGTAFGTIVLHVAPEAAVGGPLGLVQDGDMIRLDVPARRLDLLLEEAELSRRAAKRAPPRPAPTRGYARLFHDTVLQADQGCDFDFLVGRAEARRR